MNDKRNKLNCFRDYKLPPQGKYDRSSFIVRLIH